MDLAHQITYAKQTITEEDQQAVLEALNSTYITRGPKTKTFEQELANELGAEYAVCFNSGTAALQAAFFAANTSSFDRLFVPAITFIASAIGQTQGARLHIIDVDPKTANMDLFELQQAMQTPLSRGKSIITAVHMGGTPVDMELLQQSIQEPDCFVIEYAAHAIGSRYPSGEKVGSCKNSDVTIFSFHPAKTITTAEGGAALTNSASIKEKLELFRDNGIKRDSQTSYQVQSLTGNFHLSELQAALGSSQLQKLPNFVEKRLSLMQAYQSNLQGKEGIFLLHEEVNSYVAYHLCIVLIDFAFYKKTRQEVMEKLKEKGIGTQIHYIPLYRHPIFAQHSELVGAEEYYQKTLSLPLYPDLKKEDVDYITDTLFAVLDS